MTSLHNLAIDLPYPAHCYGSQLLPDDNSNYVPGCYVEKDDIIVVNPTNVYVVDAPVVGQNVVAHWETYWHCSQTTPTSSPQIYHMQVLQSAHASTTICTSTTTRRVKLPSSISTSVTCSARWWMTWRTAIFLTGTSRTRRRARLWQACPTPQAPPIKPQSISMHFQSCPSHRSRTFRNTWQCTILSHGPLSSTSKSFI